MNRRAILQSFALGAAGLALPIPAPVRRYFFAPAGGWNGNGGVWPRYVWDSVRDARRREHADEPVSVIARGPLNRPVTVYDVDDVVLLVGGTVIEPLGCGDFSFVSEGST